MLQIVREIKVGNSRTIEMNARNEFLPQTLKPFCGDRDVYDLPNFLTALQVEFFLQGITEDNLKIAYLAQNLAGSAARWVVKSGQLDQLDKMSYDDFIREFVGNYRGIWDPYTIICVLKKLSQGEDIHAYNNDFSKYIGMLPAGFWSEAAKISVYCLGLNRTTLREVRLAAPKTLHEATAIAVREADLGELISSPELAGISDRPRKIDNSRDPYQIMLKVLALKQKSTIEAYNEAFTQYMDLLPEGYWSEQAQIHQYLKGLKDPTLRNLRIQPPKTLGDAMEFAYRVEYQRHGEKSGMPTLESLRDEYYARESDEFGITRYSRDTPRKKSSRQHCIKNKLCFKCKEPGHISRDCCSKMVGNH